MLTLNTYSVLNTLAIVMLEGVTTGLSGLSCVVGLSVEESALEEEQFVRIYPLCLGLPLERSVQQSPLTSSSLVGKGAQGTGLAAQNMAPPPLLE